MHLYCNLDTKIDSTSAIVQVLHQYVILVDGEQKVLGNLEMFSVVVEVTILTVLVLAEHCLSMAGLALLSCLDVDVDILCTEKNVVITSEIRILICYSMNLFAL